MSKICEFEIGYFDDDGAHAAVHLVATDEEDAIAKVGIMYGIKRSQIWSIVNRDGETFTIKGMPVHIDHALPPGHIRYSYEPSKIDDGFAEFAKKWKMEKKRGCDHEWRTDQWFTTMKYETCKKCGKKKEEI